MPLDPAELRRGRIVYAIYPFAAAFPATVEHQGEFIEVASVEELAQLRGGKPTKLVTEVRLRPVLLLHDGTRGEHADVLCLRVNTVKPKHRQDTTTWRKIEKHEHPFFFHLPKDPRYGLPEESVIALASVGTINKSAIVRLAPRGELNIHEMQIISERLHSVLALDLARQLAGRAKQLVAKLAEQSQADS
jgi:hypothetical protein